MTPATAADEMMKQRKRAWCNIQSNMLENQMAGMAQRMRDCIANKVDHIGK